MKILVTGSKGQLAQEIINILKDKKSDIGTLSDEYRKCEWIEADIASLDITDNELVKAYMLNKKPDLVLNCAAMTNVDGCETDFDTAMKVNAIGPKNLANVCNEIGAKLVHISTDYVFDGKGDVPYREWDLPNPQTVYGKSKLLGENYVRENTNKYFIIRTAWLYGRYGKNFVKTMLKLGQNKESINVVNDQIGNPTNANDLAHHILKLALTEKYGIYHCTGDGECTWYDFAKKIMEYSGKACKVLPCTSEEFKSPAKRPAFSSLDNLMLKLTVGDEMRDWQIALRTYIDDLQGEVK